jgi:hypothetical protein
MPIFLVVLALVFCGLVFWGARRIMRDIEQPDDRED